MNDAIKINQLLVKHKASFANVVDFNPLTEKYISLDFTADNQSLISEIIQDTALFCDYIDDILRSGEAKFGVGGYMENRTIYARSSHFDSEEGEPRRLHLGIDIWGPTFTPVYAFMDAKVHSFAFNNHFGDYGTTIILEHELENNIFYSLYGHLSLKNLEDLEKGKFIAKGDNFCDFGLPEENGNWPPHLHFQLMCNMEGKEGDYPGVAKFSTKELWLQKIPDANILLDF